MINHDFMRDVLAERKFLIKIADVKYVNVPHFDELSVKSIYPMFQADAEVMKYLPSSLPAGKLPDR